MFERGNGICPCLLLDIIINQCYLSLSHSLQTEAFGIYYALCVPLRQMEVEGCVDVVTTLQRLREQRPGILTSQVMKGGK